MTLKPVPMVLTLQVLVTNVSVERLQTKHQVKTCSLSALTQEFVNLEEIVLEAVLVLPL